ncbi:ASCH domain-containing protein [Streptomyces sp. NBC_00441]|uniref:ASCH domain-containing protein n=1 Tax=Streptomyces sp. NBC_00441 TaxID=2975742 RepID=UPI002E28E8D0|nr:ASCH domain-containing protein [Streptomyces sp. NBC_00441]
MRALTIRQPWADAIAHGTKRTENRSWATPSKHLGTRILIHAAAATDKKAVLPPEANVGRAFGRIPIAQRSAIIAVATLTECHFDKGMQCCNPWGMDGYFHWTLTDVTALPEPVPAKGALGFWAPTEEIVNAALRQETGVAW